jgi:gliding motility-associated-like protein
MKKLKLNYYILFPLLILSLQNFATHIVGGEIYYDCLGSNNYQITLKLYRDCTPGTTFYDNPAYIFIYNSAGTFVDSLKIPFPGSDTLPVSLSDPCFSPPSNVCVEEAIYQTTINLPPSSGGYDIVYQRCCRNGTILNIINPGNTGASYTIHIPDPGLATCNNSPRYTNFPPIFLCAGMPLNFDHSATDADGDSLHYELCDPYIGLDSVCTTLGFNTYNCPIIGSPPPYAQVSWASPYSGTYPLSSLPALAIDPVTGLMTGTPNMLGQWVVGVCVSEYRNGVLLSVNKRDFQFNVVNCGILTPTTQTICSGDSTSIGLYTNISSTTFSWTVVQSGVTGATADTGSIISQTLITTGNIPGIAVYTITPHIDSCSGFSVTDTVTVNPPDNASFVYSSATFCQSGTNPTPALTGLPGGTFSASPTGLSINGATGTINLSASSTGTYTVSYTTNGICPATSTIPITIADTAIVATFGYSNTIFCQNGQDPLPIYSSGGSGGFFSATPVGLTFINVNTGAIDLSASLPGTYIITNTIPPSGTCSSANATTTVIITAADNASFHYSSGTYCTSGTNPTPVITGMTGGIFISTPAGLSLNTSTGSINLSASLLGVYTVNYTTTGICPNTSSLTITITDTTPSTNFSYQYSSFCQYANNPVPFFANGSSAGIFSAAPAGLVFINVNTGEIDIMASTPGTYTVTNTIPASGTCLMSSSATTITINSSPVILYSSGLQIGCDSMTTSINLTSSVPGTTYSWTVVQLALSGASAGSGSSIFQDLHLTGNSQGSVSYTIIPNAGGCVGAPLVIPIILNPLPVADTSALITSPATCGEPTGSLFGISMLSGQPSFHYQWLDSTGTIIGTSSNIANLNAGQYTLNVTDANGCSTSAGSFTVGSTAGVTAAFITDTATGETPLMVNFTNSSIGASGYLWQFGTGDTSSYINPQYIFELPGDFTVCLIASNTNGCYDTACSDIHVSVNSVFIVPNVFTPNGDHSNDLFTIIGTGLKTMDAEIYNRWGQKLYEWHTIHGGWNGYTASGVPASEGTYYYLINASKLDGKEYHAEGFILLLRD